MFYIQPTPYDILTNMQTPHERQALILLLVLIAFGGIVLYGNGFPGSQSLQTNETRR